MEDGFRRLRGMTGVGMTWGLLWGVIGTVIGILIGVVSPGAWTWGNPILEWAMGMGMYGFVSGVGFAGVLSLAERNRTLRDLYLPRVALWGVLGSAAVPLIFGALGMFGAGTTVLDVLGAMGVTAFLGGTFAPGAVALARSPRLASPEERDLLE